MRNGGYQPKPDKKFNKNNPPKGGSGVRVNFNEYGSVTSIQEAIEQFIANVQMLTFASPLHMKMILPQKVVDAFNLEASKHLRVPVPKMPGVSKVSRKEALVKWSATCVADAMVEILNEGEGKWVPNSKKKRSKK